MATSKDYHICAIKSGTAKAAYQGPLASGLNRRAFLKTSVAISLLAGFPLLKPNIAASSSNAGDGKPKVRNTSGSLFTQQQRKTLYAVQMHLFPDDGDGPSARDLNALDYLEWALTDPQNIDDGDPEFIVENINLISIDEISSPIKAEIKIRYNDTGQAGTIIPYENDQLKISFDKPQKSITPGQTAVFFSNNNVIGGGIIKNRV